MRSPEHLVVAGWWRSAALFSPAASMVVVRPSAVGVEAVDGDLAGGHRRKGRDEGHRSGEGGVELDERRLGREVGVAERGAEAVVAVERIGERAHRQHAPVGRPQDRLRADARVHEQRPACLLPACRFFAVRDLDAVHPAARAQPGALARA